MASRRFALGLMAAGLALSAGSAQAFTFWSNSNGASSFFTWSGGGSSNGLFNDPVVVGNTFNFFPTNFQATSSNGVAGSANDQAQVRLTANPNNRFTQIRITEFGDWNILGSGSVSVGGGAFVTDMLVSRPTQMGPLVTNPGMPITTSNSSGIWSASVIIDLESVIGPDWTDVTLNFSNTLQATSGANSTSLIRKKLATGPSIIIEIIPAPGTAALLGLGGIVLSRRRR